MSKLIHGDVILRGAKNVDLSKLTRVMDNVLAEGEVTGHLHALGVTHKSVRRMTEKELSSNPGFQLYRNDQGQLYVQIEVDTPLSHQEHNTRIVPAGIWEVRIAREINPFTQAIGTVRD